jgi:glucoamylase
MLHLSPFTLAVEIAALLAAADLADENDEPGVAAYLRETADAWNTSIERWTYATDTDLARETGVKGCVCYTRWKALPMTAPLFA